MQSARSFMHAAQRGVVTQPSVRGASSSAATTAQQHIISHPTHTEEWIVANIQDGGVLFSDQEVDSAAEALGLTQCPKVDSDTSSDSARANELMAVADNSIRESGRRNDLAGREEQHLSALVRMSIRLAHDWEVQSLIMQKFRNDPVLAEEMANIMRKPAGPLRDGLVLGPARATAALCIEELPDDDENASHDGFMSKIMQRFVRIMVAIRNGVGHGFRALAERLAKVFGGHEPHLEGEGVSRDFVSFIPKQAMMLAALIIVVCLAGRGGMPIVRA